MNKQYILEEIKRTAEANGSVPLGRQKFLQETGIKESDWYGKYWARWSDAVREAGFAPNRMQGAYEEAFLIGKFVELLRELGRYPAAGDLLLKARNDPGFPSTSTFGRFGTRSQFASRIIEYCRGREDFEDVVHLCEPVAGDSRLQSDKPAEGSDDIGFVYLLKSGRFYKIGKSNAVGRRERELAIQLPEKTSTVHVIRTDDPVGIEAYWHKRFAAQRKNGEWFELSGSDVKAFRRRKFM